MSSARPSGREALPLAGGLLAIAAATFAYTRLLTISNAATVSTTFLLIVLLVAAASTFRVAVTVSVAAVLAINYFFLPPVGTFTIADPQNWTALFTFLAVSVVASNLSAVARARTDEARARRDELARLFDLSRDVLITTEGRDAILGLARSVARRFDLASVAIALPKHATWELYEAGPLTISLDLNQLSLAFAMEKRMTAADAAARHDLRSLAPLLGASSRPQLAAANAALDRFMTVHTEITALSRRNTNVRSLALSLNEKGKVTGAGEETLRELRDALAKRGFTATR